jgi:HAMP domain-containing protein
MSFLRRASITLILGALLGAMGLLLVAVSIDGVIASQRRSAEAARIEALMRADEIMFIAVNQSRVERSLILPALPAPGPAAAGLLGEIEAAHRATEAQGAAAIAALAALDQPGLVAALATLRSIHETWDRLRPQALQLLALVRQARDSEAVTRIQHALLAWSEGFATTSLALEDAARLIDPVVDHLLVMKDAAWEARNFAGVQFLSVEQANAAGRPWTEAEIQAAAEARGHVASAWPKLVSAAARADADPLLAAAVAKARTVFMGLIEGDHASRIAALASGHALDLPARPTHDRYQDAVTTIAGVAGVAMQQAVARAERQHRAAALSLIRDIVILMLAVTFTVSGLLVAQRRIARPIREMTGAMRRLAAHDVAVAVPGAGRGDEIGAMAGALEVFRGSMIAAERLAAEQQAEQAARERRAAQLAQLVRGFQQRVGETVARLAAGAASLEATAHAMSGTAGTTNELTASVSAAADRASAHAGSVAEAAEQLTASIGEIGRRVAECAQSLKINRTWK